MPTIVYSVAPVGSVSVLRKYVPEDQSIDEKEPIVGMPPPISMLTSPLAFVLGLGLKISWYTTVPVADPCNILILIPTP